MQHKRCINGSFTIKPKTLILRLNICGRRNSYCSFSLIDHRKRLRYPLLWKIFYHGSRRSYFRGSLSVIRWPPKGNCSLQEWIQAFRRKPVQSEAWLLYPIQAMADRVNNNAGRITGMHLFHYFTPVSFHCSRTLEKFIPYFFG